MTTDLAALSVRLGPDFARRYQLERPLGAGGMAEVFRGRDVQLGRAVAVKFQMRDESFAEASRERFHFEAQAGARIQDENVVRVYEYGEGRGCWWMACELIEGFSLADALDTAGGRFTLVRALDAAVQVTRGLKAIHEAGIVHRDLKPENVLIGTLDGLHKISDLGLAAGEGRGFQTEAGLVLGTPRYMAPEQVRDQTGPSADLYALGTLMFVMLSGEFPFENKNELELISDKLKAERPSRRLSELRPEYDGPVDDVVMRLLERDPAKRPASAEELLPVLERFHVKAKEGKPISRSAANRPPAAGPSGGRRVGSKGVSARTVVGSKPLIARAVGASGGVRGALVAVARSPRATGALVGGLALAMGACIALGVYLRRGPVSFPVDLRAGEWGFAVTVAVPKDAGLPLAPARLVFPAGAPVDGTIEGGEQQFAVGLAHLRDLGPSMVMEVNQRAAGEPQRFRLGIDPEQLTRVRAEWDKRAMEVAELAENGGLSPAGDPAQNYDADRFENHGALPPDVLVQVGDLERKLPRAFGASRRAWADLADWMRGDAPLEQKMRLYRALARWEVGAMEVGRQPRANPKRFPNQPAPRRAHPLVSVLRALVEVRVKYVHESVLGPPEVVTGMTNGANIRWIRNLRSPTPARYTSIADVVGSAMLTDIATIALKIAPPGPQAPRYIEKLKVTAFECARLAGKQMLEVEPSREIDANAQGRYGLRVSIIEFYPTSAVRVTVPLAAGAPLDVWLGQPDVREHRAACPDGCKNWRHSHVYEILLPHGLRVAQAAKVGLRQGPVVPIDADAVRVPCERRESASPGEEREDIIESTYATLVVSDLAWILVP